MSISSLGRQEWITWVRRRRRYKARSREQIIACDAAVTKPKISFLGVVNFLCRCIAKDKTEETHSEYKSFISFEERDQDQTFCSWFCDYIKHLNVCLKHYLLQQACTDAIVVLVFGQKCFKIYAFKNLCHARPYPKTWMVGSNVQKWTHNFNESNICRFHLQASLM